MRLGHRSVPIELDFAARRVHRETAELAAQGRQA
jgi:hypothetical protein